MFRTAQIVTSTQLIRHFRTFSKHIGRFHEPILVTQKGGKCLVLVEAELFESLVEHRM